MRCHNLYYWALIVNAYNSFQCIDTEFRDHDDERGAILVGCDSSIKIYFKQIPPCYNKDYFFEIEKGAMKTRHLPLQKKSHPCFLKSFRLAVLSLIGVLCFWICLESVFSSSKISRCGICFSRDQRFYLFWLRTWILSPKIFLIFL